jgi:hypothetical protein
MEGGRMKPKKLNTPEAKVIREIDSWTDDQVKEFRRLTQDENKPPKVAYLRVKNSRRNSG